MAALLRSTSDWVVNDKRVERISRQEGLKVQPRQPKRSRIWPSGGACIRLCAERSNHVWSYDFVEDRTHDGRKYRMLNVVDEFTRECLSITINRKLKSSDVIDVLSDLFILRGVPEHIRSDNGPEFVVKPFRTGLPPLVPGPPTSSRGARGRMATSRASMPASVTSFSMARSSTPSLRPGS
jgi:transposase InsO family protein